MARRTGILLLMCAALGLGAQEKANPRKAAPGESTDNTIKFYQGRIGRDPDDFFNYDKLGAAYIRKARETGDVAYYNLAEAVLRKSLDLESTHREAIAATAHLASVYFSEHRFNDALAYAEKALSFGTGDLSPHATIGDALLEMGEYERASTAYSHLRQREGDLAPHSGLVYLLETRNSTLQFMRGEPQDSIRHMRKAVQLASEAQMPEESIAWTQFTLAEELFQVGDLPGAEQANQDALKTYPQYHRALAGLAKVRGAQGRLSEAAELYRRALAVVPMPVYAAALGDVYTKMGMPAEARKQYDLVEFIARLSAISKNVFNRELALFYADHDIKLKEALEFAQEELKVRKDIYTWDCLAWALYKNGRLDEAAGAMSKAMALNTKDALLSFHAGMIYLGLKEDKKARDYLKGSLAMNPQFHVIYADLARQELREIDARIGAEAQAREERPIQTSRDSWLERSSPIDRGGHPLC